MITDLQKANIWKRVSAGLFDGILLGILAVGIAVLISLITGYDAKTQALSGYYAQYERQYGVSFSVTEEEFFASSPEEQARYEEAYAALTADPEVLRAYQTVLNLTLVMISLGLLLAFAILEFFIPFYLGHGQTAGKKIFGIAVMRTSGVRMNTVSFFIRTFLGKYTVETMIPVLILILLYFNAIGLAGTLVLIGLLILQLVLFFVTPGHSLIHDRMADTVAVDMSSQLIFDTEEARLEYIKKEAAEKASRSVY